MKFGLWASDDFKILQNRVYIFLAFLTSHICPCSSFSTIFFLLSRHRHLVVDAFNSVVTNFNLRIETLSLKSGEKVEVELRIECSFWSQGGAITWLRGWIYGFLHSICCLSHLKKLLSNSLVFLRRELRCYAFLGSDENVVLCSKSMFQDKIEATTTHGGTVLMAMNFHSLLGDFRLEWTTKKCAWTSSDYRNDAET